MWTYIQLTGEMLDPTGKVLAVGYSGCNSCKNNPLMQKAHNEGPIPIGTYTIFGPIPNTPTHGPYVLPLEPSPQNEMHGRAGFLIHGDSKVDPGSASEGCIILGRQAREAIWASGDHQIQVVSGYMPPSDLSAGDL